jgi:hypothetical protein
MQLTPPVYATGRYEVKAPYVLVDKVDYTCHAIRTFEDCIERGIDIYNDIYAPFGVERTTFLDDETKGINIITLKSIGQVTVYIPDSFILSYPNMGEALPQRLIVSVDLGIISSHWDAQYLLTKIQNLASDVVGSEPKVTLLSIPVLGRASADDVPALDNVRDIDISNRTSDHAKAQRLEKNNTLLRDKIISLEAKIIAQ